MTALIDPPAWARRLQNAATEASGRSSAWSTRLQRRLLAHGQAQVTPEALAAFLTRFGEQHGPDVYADLAQLTARFLADVLTLVGRTSEDYLTSLVPRSRLIDVGPRPVAPPPPQHGSQAEWTVWFQLFGARMAEQQVWGGRMYGVVLDEVSAGRLTPQEAQGAGNDFLRLRLPVLLADLAELFSDFQGELLALGEDTVEELLAVLFDEPRADEVVVRVHGAPGSACTGALAVDSEGSDMATVTCLINPEPGFTLAAEPARFALAPGESRTVKLRVTLDAAALPGSQSAGTVVIRGQGERELVVRVDALIDA